jgi:hypothetical protein
MNIRPALATAAALLTLAAASASHASATAASIWVNIATPNDASIVPPGPADATFAPGLINYDSRVTGYTISQFLNNPTFMNTSGAFDPNAASNNIFVQITGTLGLQHGNNSFVVEHDDGVVLNVAGFGNVVFEPGPTAPDVTPFNVFNAGAAGNFDFTLNYTECCGPPAVLLFTVNDVNVGGIPEPATWSLMLLGVGGIGGMMRRKTRQLAAA